MKLFVLALFFCTVLGNGDFDQLRLELDVLEDRVDELMLLRQQVELLKAEIATMRERGANPDYVSFSVALRGGHMDLNSGSNVAYNTVITNKGNDYNIAAAEFVAPSHGVYVFAVASASPDSSSCHLRIIKNNDAANGNFEAFGSFNNYLRTGSNVGVLELNAGDKVAVRSTGNCRLDGQNWRVATFSGFQVA